MSPWLRGQSKELTRKLVHSWCGSPQEAFDGTVKDEISDIKRLEV
jgi:hypothetical protein